MAAKSSDKIYTQPELREKLKDKIKADDKGGKPGQWSARKGQLLAHEYEAQGGGYEKETKTEAQKHLDQWTDEKWTTEDGKDAERDGGTTRYLPQEAWDKLTPTGKKAANVKKQEGFQHGHQHVANTRAAKTARLETSHSKK